MSLRVCSPNTVLAACWGGRLFQPGSKAIQPGLFLIFYPEIISNLQKSCKESKKTTCTPFIQIDLLTVCHFCFTTCTRSRSRSRSVTSPLPPPEPFEREGHTLWCAFPKHTDIFLHNHSTVINLRTFNSEQHFNRGSILLFCQWTQ